MFQHNGLVERHNWSLMDITRCWLLNKHFPQFSWGDVHVLLFWIFDSLMDTKEDSKIKKFLKRNHLLLICRLLVQFFMFIWTNQTFANSHYDQKLAFIQLKYLGEWVSMLPTIHSSNYHLPRCLNHWNKWCNFLQQT
jgi:hypothetical protein